nr:hypothetical protein [uncultured Holophaga sp.]
MKAVARRKAVQPHVCGPGCHHDHHLTGEQLFHAPGESPSVRSVTRDLSFASPVAGAAVTAALTRCVEAVRDWAVSGRFLVGHIKVFAESSVQENLWLASTGRKVNTQVSGGWDGAALTALTLHVTAIIFGPDPETLQEIVDRELERELVQLQS